MLMAHTNGGTVMGLLDRAKDMLGDHKDQVVSGIEQPKT